MNLEHHNRNPDCITHPDKCLVKVYPMAVYQYDYDRCLVVFTFREHTSVEVKRIGKIIVFESKARIAISTDAFM